MNVCVVLKESMFSEETSAEVWGVFGESEGSTALDNAKLELGIRLRGEWENELVYRSEGSYFTLHEETVQGG